MVVISPEQITDVMSQGGTQVLLLMWLNKKKNTVPSMPKKTSGDRVVAMAFLSKMVSGRLAK